MHTPTPIIADPRDAELSQLRAEVEACRIVVGQHPGLLNRIEKLEEELFDERLAHGLLREKYDQLEEASIGVLDIRDQLHRVERYLVARDIDYQAVSAGRLT